MPKPFPPSIFQKQAEIIAAGSDQNKLIAREITKDILHQKFIEAALNLDASIVEPFIPEDMMLQDLSKYAFLDYLKGHFDHIWQMHPEDWRVEPSAFTCLVCKYGKPLAGFEVFAGVEYRPYYRFSYFVETNKQGETTDIYICTRFIKNADFPLKLKA